MSHQPYKWTETGIPCYRSREAPPFLLTREELWTLGLVPTKGPAAIVDTRYDPKPLYLVTEATLALALPESWPPRR